MPILMDYSSNLNLENMAQAGASVEEAESVAASHGAQWLYVIGMQMQTPTPSTKPASSSMWGVEQTRFAPGLTMRKRLPVNSGKP